MTVKIPITEEYQGGHISKLFFLRYASSRNLEDLDEWRQTGCRTAFADWHLAKWGARIEKNQHPIILEFDNEEDATYFLLRWS